MDFEERLRKAVDRGNRRNDAKRQQEREARLNEEELKSLHSRYRLMLSEKIEGCMKVLPSHFPGFKFETIFGEKGWGAACSRDDLQLSGGKRTNNYTRLEVTIRPYSDAHVIDLYAKGTIANKEVFTRNHFEKLADVDTDTFVSLIDTWVLEFAELYAAKR